MKVLVIVTSCETRRIDRLTQLPLGYLAGFWPRPSSRMVAPSFSAVPMRLSMRSLAWGEMTGPRSAPSSKPPFMESSFARSAISAVHSLVSPTRTSVLRAMQR